MALADYIDSKPVIDTARLRLRPLRPEDVPALEEWMPDKSIYAYWGKGPGKTDKNPALLFAKPARPTKSFHLGIKETASGRVIGELWVYLIDRDRMACVSIRVAPSFRSRTSGLQKVQPSFRCFSIYSAQRV